MIIKLKIDSELMDNIDTLIKDYRILLFNKDRVLFNNILSEKILKPEDIFKVLLYLAKIGYVSERVRYNQ